MTDQGRNLDLVVDEDVIVGRMLAGISLAFAAIGYVAGPWIAAGRSDDTGWMALGAGFVFVAMGLFIGTSVMPALSMSHRAGAHVEVAPGGSCCTTATSSPILSSSPQPRSSASKRSTAVTIRTGRTGPRDDGTSD